jgi:hypothetical protein
MNVTQLINSKGKAVANQLIIHDGDNITFQSYDSKIATYNKQDKTLKLCGDLWDYSNTTRKHFSQFINDFTAFGYDNKSQFLQLIEELNDRIKTVQ